MRLKIREVSVKRKQSTANRYSKRIIAYCLIMTTILMFADIVLCIIAEEQIDPVSVGAFATVIISELFSSAWIRVTKTKNEKQTQSVEEFYNEISQPEPQERGVMK